LDLTTSRASSLESLDDGHGLIINLAEDDVLAIEPAGEDGGDEELGTVGIWSSVGHGEKSWLGVGDLEVLIGELLTVDGLATGTVSAGEVTSLEHELWDDAVERRTSIAESLLASAESTEVLSGLWDYVIVELECDTAGLVLDLGSWVSLVIQDWSLPGNIEVSLNGHIGR